MLSRDDRELKRRGIYKSKDKSGNTIYVEDLDRLKCDKEKRSNLIVDIVDIVADIIEFIVDVVVDIVDGLV